MIKNIIFDIGRVLVGFEWKEYILSLFDEETAKAVTDAMWTTGYWHELDRGILAEEEVLALFFSAAPAYQDEIQKAYDHVGECVTRREAAIPWIESLKDQGYKVYFLSNYSVPLQEKNPEALDFLSHMDGGVFSCDVKHIKPDFAIYQSLLDKYGLTPEECLFIDDREDNVRAAQKLGIQAIKYIDHAQAVEDIGKFCRYSRYQISPMSKGFVQIYTGNGKGKTTAALGLAMRAAGAGLKVYIGEFIKEMEYGEIGILKVRFPEVTVELFGIETGCIIDREVSEEDIRAAKEGFDRAKEVVMSGEYDLVILDEITIPVSMDILPEKSVLDLMESKPEGVELVMTGRNATIEMIRRADLVTEMREIKHYYHEGVLSRKGIEC